MSVSVSLPQDTFVSVSDQKKSSIEYLSIVQTKYKTSFEFSRMCFTVQLSMFFSVVVFLFLRQLDHNNMHFR